MAATLSIPVPNQLTDGVLYHGSDINAIVTTAVLANAGSGNGEIAAGAIASGATYGGVAGTAGAATPALRPLSGPGAGPGRIISAVLIGAAQANQIFFRWTADVATTINSIELNAYASGPDWITGQALIGQVSINGIPNAGTATLATNTPYFKQAVSIPVAAGQTVDFQFSQVGTGAQPGNYVQMNINITP